MKLVFWLQTQPVAEHKQTFLKVIKRPFRESFALGNIFFKPLSLKWKYLHGSQFMKLIYQQFDKILFAGKTIFFYVYAKAFSMSIKTVSCDNRKNTAQHKCKCENYGNVLLLFALWQEKVRRMLDWLPIQALTLQSLVPKVVNTLNDENNLLDSGCDLCKSVNSKWK